MIHHTLAGLCREVENNQVHTTGPQDAITKNSSVRGCFCFLVHFRVYGRGCAMAYYKMLIEVWCDFDPRKSDLKEIADM
jgi:hypothetical protein